MNAPDQITLASLECVAMPNGEVICLGKTLGWIDDFGEHLRPCGGDADGPGIRSEAKAVGVHDRGTYKPMIVFRVAPENERERRILARAGFGLQPEEQAAYTFFYDVDHGDCSYDPCKLTDQRTCGTAARFIRDERGFDRLRHGEFLDCECIRGESVRPVTFEDEFDNYDCKR